MDALELIIKGRKNFLFIKLVEAEANGKWDDILFYRKQAAELFVTIMHHKHGRDAVSGDKIYNAVLRIWDDLTWVDFDGYIDTPVRQRVDESLKTIGFMLDMLIRT